LTKYQFTSTMVTRWLRHWHGCICFGLDAGATQTSINVSCRNRADPWAGMRMQAGCRVYDASSAIAVRF